MDSSVEPAVARFHVLVGAMLSSQTKDPVTFGAVTRLKEHGLTVDSVLKTEVGTLAALIKPVGFYNRKARAMSSAPVTRLTPPASPPGCPPAQDVRHPARAVWR